LLAFIYGEEKKEVTGSSRLAETPLPYKHAGYQRFVDSNGLPGISPPWGTLSAVDLNSGE